MLEEKTYRNYKELCYAMDWNISTGNSKKAQFKELECLCDYHKEGQKIIINEIYEIPKTRLAFGLYKEDIELLLLDLLARHEGNFISLTIKNILRALEMVNDNFVNSYNYTDSVNQFKKLNKEIGVDVDIIGDIFYLVKNKNQRNLQSALKDLVNKSLILWEMRIKVCRHVIVLDYDEYGNLILDEDGQPVILESYEQYDYATNDEKEIILNTENQIMKEMKIKNKTYFNINKDMRKVFVQKVNRKLKTVGIQFYYYTYDITYNSDEILKELNRSELAEVRNRLNKKVLEGMLKTIENNSNKTKDKYKKSIGKTLPFDAPEIDSIRYKDKYKKDGDKTAKAIIDRKTRIHINK